MLLPPTEVIKDLRLAEDSEFFRSLSGRSAKILSSAVLCTPPNQDLLTKVLDNRENMINANNDLSDSLSSHIGKIPENHSQTLNMMVNESVVGRRHSAAALSFLTLGQPSLKELAARVHSDLGFPADNFRMLPAQTVAQPSERATVYPAPARINQLLNVLEHALWSLGAGSCLSAGIIVKVGLLHCHLFNDGNKRTGRALYSAFVGSETSKIPVPLVLLSCISRESYMIKLRRAVLLGDLKPVTLFTLSALESFSYLLDR